jgi:hypothetical protein
MSRPIPERLKHEFIGYMQAGYDDDDAPDGAWFARMEDDARDFMRQHRLRGEENDAVHQLLGWMESAENQLREDDGDNAWFHDPDMGDR